jgi:hypothetical protein
MATVFACDKDSESMLVSYTSQPILAFWFHEAMESTRTLSSIKVEPNSVDSRSSERRDSAGRFSAMILLLKSMDELNLLVW